MDRTKTITIGDVCEIICKHCVKAHGRCLHKWDCPLLTEIAKYIDRKTESSSEKPNNCEVSEIPTGSIISKMEQVEDEPKTESIVGNSDTENAKYTSDCPWR